MHAIDADSPIIRNPRAFARQHVDQFLLGAGEPKRRSSSPLLEPACRA
jgi:hypothetical protein